MTMPRPLRLAAGAITATALWTAALTYLPAPADAHHPELTATVRCNMVTATATAWATADADHRVNADVRLTVDGVDAARGEFTAANGYTYTRTIPVTPGRHVVRAVAAVPWGPGQEYGSSGTFAEATVDVVGPCRDIVIPNPPTTLVVVDLPPTTTSSSTVGTTTTTPPAAPVVLTPRFAG